MHLRFPWRRDRIEALPEAYTRVTDPERFRPLHAFALTLVQRLRADFEVGEREAFELLPGFMGPVDAARPPVTLTPTTPGAASIAIAFTSFPSLLVRCGRWFGTAFPECACDACGATAEQEIARLEEIVGDVVAGQFSEELVIPLIGHARVRWWLGGAWGGDGHQRSGGMTVVRRDVARRLRSGGSGRVQWLPWSRRPERGG